MSRCARLTAYLPSDKPRCCCCLPGLPKGATMAGLTKNLSKENVAFDLGSSAELARKGMEMAGKPAPPQLSGTGSRAATPPRLARPSMARPRHPQDDPLHPTHARATCLAPCCALRPFVACPSVARGGMLACQWRNTVCASSAG